MFYLNGEYYADNQGCALSITDRGFLLADGLFETLRAEQGQALYFAEHYQRLRYGAKLLQITLTLSLKELHNAVTELLHQNDLTQQTSAVRITLTRGIGERGINIAQQQKPTLLITAKAYQAPTTTAHACISDIGINEHSPFANIKTLNYLDNIMARARAQQAGYDEAILLNSKREVVCSSIGNLFALIDNCYYTPPLHSGCLAGISRKQLLEKGKYLGVYTAEKTLCREDLKNSQHVFHCNSLIKEQRLLLTP